MNWRSRTVGLLMCVLAAALPARGEKLVVDTDKLDPQLAETLRKGDAKIVSEREAKRAVERSEHAAKAEKSWEEATPGAKTLAIVILVVLGGLLLVAAFFAPGAVAVGLLVSSCEV